MALRNPSKRQILAEVQREARRQGVRPSLLAGLIQQESGFNPRARSGAGAFGLTQLMPATARGLHVNPNDWRSQVHGGARYLANAMRQFKSPALALSAYNSGPGGSEGSGRIEAFPETQAYVNRVMQLQKQYAFLDRGAAAVAGPSQSNVFRGMPQGGDRSGMIPGGDMRGQPLRTVSVGVKPSSLYLSSMRRIGPLGAQIAEQAERFEPIKIVKYGDRRVDSVRHGIAPFSAHIPIYVGNGEKFGKREKQMVNLAKEYLGTPYSWGGGGPGGPSRGTAQGANTVGFDCSSFIQFVQAKNGVSVPRVTYDQFKTGRAVKKGQLQPGDAVFFHMGQRGPEHVGMYIGGGRFIEAPRTGLSIRISKLAGRSDFVGARRYGGGPGKRSNRRTRGD